MKKSASFIALIAAAIGFIAGYALKPAPHSSAGAQSESFSLVPSALAQEKKSELMPFNYNSPASLRLHPTRRPQCIGALTISAKPTLNLPKLLPRP